LELPYQRPWKGSYGKGDLHDLPTSLDGYFMLFPLWETMVSHSLGINVYIRLRRCGKPVVFPLDDDLQMPPAFDDGLQGALVAVVHLAPKIDGLKS